MPAKRLYFHWRCRQCYRREVAGWSGKGPRYKVEREIGRGAFGVVYLANDNLLQRRVALKVISILDGLTPQERDHPVERFYREARKAA